MKGPFEAVIGLEFHVQLATETKLFCGCSAAFGAPPNTALCPLCAGLPGALPTLNRQAVNQALRVALALGATIADESLFARKSYFYPDLPKGYQISQYQEPLARGGTLQLPPSPAGPRSVTLERLHLEEDAGKMLHRDTHSLVDLDRAGVALLEIVTEPVIASPEEAAETMRTLRQLVRTLGVSRGNLEQGSLRCDANISLREAESEILGTRTEIKNLNSFRFLKKALSYEITRQRKLLENGESVVQQTRLYDADHNATRVLRDKAHAADYRYFPDPDLPPLRVDTAQLADLAATLPELPNARAQRLVEEHDLTLDVALRLCRDKELADYFEATLAAGAAARRTAAWLLSEVLSRLNDARQLSQAQLRPAELAELMELLESGRLHNAQAKQIWDTLWAEGGSARALAQQAGLFDAPSTHALEQIMAQLFEAHPAEVERLRAGDVRLRAFFVGQAMATTAGRADPMRLQRMIDNMLRIFPSCG